MPAVPARSRRTKAEQREQTRAALVAVARQAFAEQGFAATSIEHVVRSAGLTRGALYHHFDGKEALFHAVLDAVQQELAERVLHAAERHEDPWDQLVSGCRAYLIEGTDPAIARILLIDAPSVVGWSTWQSLDAAHSMRLLDDALQALVAAGTLPRQPVAPLLHLLSGAMNEAALFVARSADARRDLADTLAALENLLRGLRAMTVPKAEPGA